MMFNRERHETRESRNLKTEIGNGFACGNTSIFRLSFAGKQRKIVYSEGIL